MRRMVMAALALAVVAIAAGEAFGQQLRLPRGFWRGWLESPGGEVAFEMEFFEEGAGRSVAITNGDERIVIPNVVFEHSEVVIPFPHFDSELRGTFEEDQSRLVGTWRKTGRDGKRVEMVFRAERGERLRYPGAAAPSAGVEVAGRWRASFAESGDAVGEFRAGEEPGTVVGTFLTPTGDYGHLSGVIDGKTVRMSTFDGAHAFLFTAEIDEDGALVGEFFSGPAWREVWAAERDDDAALPDGFGLVGWDPAVDIWALEFTNERGERVTLEQELGGRSGLVLEVMGTWCPNCVDASRTLEEVRKEIPQPQMVRVVGVAFEYTADQERSLRQIAAFRARHAIAYPILLGGVADKKKVPEVLTGLNEVRSFPTTIFARRDGRVIGVHSGFSGPATGEEHARLREKFARLMVEAGQR
jgi:thiol-disulfide isomerase/thioredoxin